MLSEPPVEVPASPELGVPLDAGDEAPGAEADAAPDALTADVGAEEPTGAADTDTYWTEQLGFAGA